MRKLKRLESLIHSNDAWYCPRFFDHVYTNVDGQYATCCIGKPLPFHSKTSGPLDVINSEVMNDLRWASLSSDGKNNQLLHKYCAQCIKQEEGYGYSERMRARDGTKLPTLKQTADFLYNGEFVLKERCLYIQLRTFGNQCNLDCYMCHPRNSSTRARQNRLYKYDEILGFDPDNYDADTDGYQSMMDKVLELAPYIANWRIEGGEPLIMKNHYEFLDKLIESGHSKEIYLDLNTNATTLKSGKHRILQYFKEFKHVFINLSIDGIGKYGDYIRRKSKWETIVDNIETLKQISNVRLEIVSTLSLLSVIHFDEVKKWGKENNMNVKKHVADYPKELHPCNLPEKVKQIIRDKNPDDEVVLKCIEQRGDETDFNKAIQYLELMDRSYNFATELLDLYPELSKSFYGDYYEKR